MTKYELTLYILILTSSKYSNNDKLLYLLNKQANDFNTQYSGYFHWLENKLIHLDIKKCLFSYILIFHYLKIKLFSSTLRSMLKKIIFNPRKFNPHDVN